MEDTKPAAGATSLPTPRLSHCPARALLLLFARLETQTQDLTHV